MLLVHEFDQDDLKIAVRLAVTDQLMNPPRRSATNADQEPHNTSHISKVGTNNAYRNQGSCQRGLLALSVKFF